MKNKLPIVQGLWIGDSLSIMEQLCIKSYCYHGHEFHLYTYGEVKGVPEEAIIKDANAVIPESEIFTYKNNGSYAGFANLFRYKLLLDKGDIWTDMDMVCLKPLTFERDLAFAAQKQPVLNQSKLKTTLKSIFYRFVDIEKRVDWDIYAINCCFMYCKPNSEVMKYCYDFAEAQDNSNLSWGQTGPMLLTKAIKELDLFDFVEDTSSYCPIHLANWRQFIAADSQKYMPKVENAKAAHLWNEFWRQNGLDKSQSFDSNSIFEQWKAKYL